MAKGCSHMSSVKAEQRGQVGRVTTPGSGLCQVTPRQLLIYNFKRKLEIKGG